MDHYGYVLDRALELNYEILPMSEAVRQSSKTLRPRSILLRHDVDVSLELAVKMANFESQRMIRATYFVRLHARYYDTEDTESKSAIDRLRQVAEVGLHYELGYYQMIGGDPLTLLNRDRERMSALLNSCSFGSAAHMPGMVGHLSEEETKAAGLTYEAYAPVFTRDRKYLSDSGARWREGCLCQWLDQADHFTVLVHPVWWLNWKEPSATVIERLASGD
jgi:hypothetical protein